MPKTVFLYSDDVHLELNASFWRCEVPQKALAAKGLDVKLDNITQFHNYKDYDVFIVERNLFEPFAAIIRSLIKQGKKVYANFDDNYDEMPAYLPAYPTWHGSYNGLRIRLDEFHDMLGEVAGCIVASKELANYYSKYGKMIVIENYFPDQWLDIPTGKPIWDLGWSGNATHITSWEESKLHAALKAADYSLLLNTSDVNVINKLHGIFDCFKPWTPHSQYPSLVDDFSVGLAPLAGQYDRYRSNIKLVMYAMRGRPWVASNLEPYRDSVGGVLVNNTKREWLSGISEVFDEYDRYALLAKDWGSQYAVSKHLDEYEALIG